MIFENCSHNGFVLLLQAMLYWQHTLMVIRCQKIEFDILTVLNTDMLGSSLNICLLSHSF